MLIIELMAVLPTLLRSVIPQGNYGAGTPYVLEVPVEIINDSINEVDDTFSVTINQSNDFHVMSSPIVGAAGMACTANYVD